MSERRQGRPGAALATPFGFRRGERVRIVRCGPEADAVGEFARAVALGLADRPRWLPARYLYDAAGSRLFERICDTAEYYLTRLETELLDGAAAMISRLTGDRTLVELGAGSGRKTELLLAAYTRTYGAARYVPVDVSGDALLEMAAQLADKHPAVSIRGLHGSYEAAFPTLERLSPAMLLFLGSTIGNLNQTETAMFWRQVRQALPPGDFVLLGIDLLKDTRVINAAYNDATGWSAAFTRNIFARMNRELGSEIDLDAIEHQASYRPLWRRVEIFARMRRRQRIYLAPLDETITLERGERVMTELSRKFDLGELPVYLRRFDLETVRIFSDPAHWYGLLLLQRTRS